MTPDHVQQTIALLREEAKIKNQLADDLEKLFAGGQKVVVDRKTALTVEEVKARLKVKGGRVAGLAVALNATVEAVEKAIYQSGGDIYVAARGWVKLKEGNNE